MSSSDEVPPRVDPDFEALFRQAPAEDSADASTDDPAEESASDGPRVSAPPAGMTDTGRLFRSQGVTGNTTAVLALSSDHGGRLRTLRRSDVEAPPALPSPPEAAASFVAAADGASQAAPAQEPASEGRRARRSRTRSTNAPGGPGLPARACYVIIIGVTLIVALVNALLASGDISWPTGVAMLAATVFCALRVRREDDIVPVITPALAFFLTALTAAQFFLGSAERSLINRAVVVFFTLANNWIWILGTTVIALVIMLVRRRRT